MLSSHCFSVDGITDLIAAVNVCIARSVKCNTCCHYRRRLGRSTTLYLSKMKTLRDGSLAMGKAEVCMHMIACTFVHVDMFKE